MAMSRSFGPQTCTETRARLGAQTTNSQAPPGRGVAPRGTRQSPLSKLNGLSPRYILDCSGDTPGLLLCQRAYVDSSTFQIGVPTKRRDAPTKPYGCYCGVLTKRWGG